LEENVRDNLVDLSDELEQRVVGEVLEGKLSLSSVSGVGLSEDGVTVTGDDLSALEGGPDVLGDLVVRGVLADLGSHLLDPSEDLLVGKTAGSVCEVWTRPKETHPWRGPARPLSEAAKDKKGSERADPTKCPVWAETFPPSWSEWMVMYNRINSTNCSLSPKPSKVARLAE
jgi:hypothetical protein